MIELAAILILNHSPVPNFKSVNDFLVLEITLAVTSFSFKMCLLCVWCVFFMHLCFFIEREREYPSPISCITYA